MAVVLKVILILPLPLGVHVARIPVSVLWHALWTPVRPDAELRILVPLRRVILHQRVPRWFVRAFAFKVGDWRKHRHAIPRAAWDWEFRRIAHAGGFPGCIVQPGLDDLVAAQHVIDSLLRWQCAALGIVLGVLVESGRQRRCSLILSRLRQGWHGLGRGCRCYQFAKTPSLHSYLLRRSQSSQISVTSFGFPAADHVSVIHITRKNGYFRRAWLAVGALQSRETEKAGVDRSKGNLLDYRIVPDIAEASRFSIYCPVASVRAGFKSVGLNNALPDSVLAWKITEARNPLDAPHIHSDLVRRRRVGARGSFPAGGRVAVNCVGCRTIVQLAVHTHNLPADRRQPGEVFRNQHAEPSVRPKAGGLHRAAARKR